MDYDPPTAMTRFGMFFLAGGVALIFAFWGVLKYLDLSRPASPARPQQAPVAQLSVPPSPSPFPARPSPSIVPP